MGISARATSARRRWERTPAWMIDAVLGSVVVFVGLTSAARPGTDAGVAYRDHDALALVLILAGTLPYYLRRRAPVGVFVVTATAVVTLMLRGYDEGALPFVLLVGVYTVAAYRPAGVAAAAAAVIAVLLVVVFLGDTPGFGVGELVSSEIVFGAAMLAGWTVQSRQRRIDAFDSEQAEAALRAAADERLRIAQEVHDVVAHSLGVIAVQAGVGMKVIDSDLEEARRAFENISRTSRSSLAEIRRLLGMATPRGARPTGRPPGWATFPGWHRR